MMDDFLGQTSWRGLPHSLRVEIDELLSAEHLTKTLC